MKTTDQKAQRLIDPPSACLLFQGDPDPVCWALNAFGHHSKKEKGRGKKRGGSSQKKRQKKLGESVDFEATTFPRFQDVSKKLLSTENYLKNCQPQIILNQVLVLTCRVKLFLKMLVTVEGCSSFLSPPCHLLTPNP